MKLLARSVCAGITEKTESSDTLEAADDGRVPQSTLRKKTKLTRHGTETR